MLAVEFLGVIDCKNALNIACTVFGFLKCLLRVVADTADVGGIHRNSAAELPV